MFISELDFFLRSRRLDFALATSSESAPFFRLMLTIMLMSAGSGCQMDPSENGAPMKAS